MSPGGPAANALAQLFLVLAVLTMALKLLSLNAWRAWLCLRPDRVRLVPDEVADRMSLPAGLEERAGQLRVLGFRPLGTHLERSALRRGLPAYDFVHPDAGVFATLYASARGQPRLSLLTRLAPSGLVLTTDFTRPAVERPGEYIAQGLPDCPPELLLRAHQLKVGSAPRVEDMSWEGRLRAGRDWYQGPGRLETRRQNVPGLLWTLVALVIVASLFVGGGRPV